MQREVVEILRCRIHSARVRISVNKNSYAIFNVLLYLRGRFPSIGAEKEVDGMVVLLGVSTEVGVNQLP